MPTFVYQARNPAGQIVSGTVEAPDERQATQILWEHNLRPIVVEHKAVKGIFAFFGWPSLAERALVARQLATMISAGVHLVTALEIARDQARNRRLKEALNDVLNDVKGGYSLSTALSRHPTVFERVFVAVTKAGEAAGKLDEVLNAMAVKLERDQAFVGRVRAALIYPAFVIVAMTIVGGILVSRILPNLKAIFAGYGAELPFATRFVLGVADLLASWWWLLLLAIVLSIFFFVGWIRTPAGRSWWSIAMMRLPLFGPLIRDILVARFSSTFGLLVATGIPIIDAIFLVAEAMGNEEYRSTLHTVASEVERGVPMSVPLGRTPLFPSIVSQMIGVGEQTGTIDKILTRLTALFEERIEVRTKTIGSLVEPVVVVLLGLGVALLVFAVIVPIYQISQFVQ